MERIKRVLICGLGAIGGYYAWKLAENEDIDLKVLVDKDRFERYRKEPRVINGKPYEFDYVLPEQGLFSPDLIIISTKSSGLSDAIKNISAYVGEDTIIMSFLNGVTSEKELAKVYGDKRVLYSYLIGHTFFRTGKNINHDGKAKVVFGSIRENDKNVEFVKELFDSVQIRYMIESDILSSLWKKYCFNCCLNQISAVKRMTFGEIKKSEECLELIKNISDEVSQIAKKEGISGADEFYQSTLDFLELMIPEGKTSMLQDIEAGIKPEIDIFGETIVKLGQKYGIDTPYNKKLSDVISKLGR